MAMFITTNDGKVLNIPVGQDHDIDPNTVVEVQADCDELVRCVMLTGMGSVNDLRVIRWFGDHAKFIVANWK